MGCSSPQYRANNQQIWKLYEFPNIFSFIFPSFMIFPDMEYVFAVFKVSSWLYNRDKSLKLDFPRIVFWTPYPDLSVSVVNVLI